MKHNNQMLDSLFTTLNRINIKVILCYFFVDLLQKSQCEFNKQKYLVKFHLVSQQQRKVRTVKCNISVTSEIA